MAQFQVVYEVNGGSPRVEVVEAADKFSAWRKVTDPFSQEAVVPLLQPPGRMAYILYPESRWVTEDWVITQAHDQMVNDALDAEAARVGAENVPDGWWPEVPMPDYFAAREYLEDRGDVTFARDEREQDISPSEWREVDGDHEYDEERS